jgi:hypothetical protein
VALFFAAHRALGALVYSMFEWPKEHYRFGNDVTYAWYWRESIKEHAALAQPLRAGVTLGVYVTYALPYLAIAGAAAVAVRAAAGLWRRAASWEFALVGGAALAAVSPLFVAPVRPDLVHVAYLGSFGLLGLAAAVEPATRRWRHARLGVGLALALLGTAALGTHLGKTVRTWNASRALGSWRAEILKLSGADRIAREVPAGERIVIGAMGGFYYLYLRPPGVPNTYMPARWVQYLSDTQWRKAADRILADRPAALLLVGVQWGELSRRRPELRELYRADRGLWVLK